MLTRILGRLVSARDRLTDWLGRATDCGDLGPDEQARRE